MKRYRALFQDIQLSTHRNLLRKKNTRKFICDLENRNQWRSPLTFSSHICSVAFVKLALFAEPLPTSHFVFIGIRSLLSCGGPFDVLTFSRQPFGQKHGWDEVVNRFTSTEWPHSADEEHVTPTKDLEWRFLNSYFSFSTNLNFELFNTLCLSRRLYRTEKAVKSHTGPT